MPLDTSRHHAMAISSLIKEEDDCNPFYQPPIMPPSLSSTTSRSSECYSLHPFSSATHSHSSSSFLDASTDATTTGTLLLDFSNRSQSMQERRQRNKEASARYRAKRNQRNEDLRNVVAKLIHQNNVLFTALQEAYENEGRDAPRSLDEVVVLMDQTKQHNYIHSPSSSPSSYPSSLYHNSNVHSSAPISSNH